MPSKKEDRDEISCNLALYNGDIKEVVVEYKDVVQTMGVAMDSKGTSTTSFAQRFNSAIRKWAILHGRLNNAAVPFRVRLGRFYIEVVGVLLYSASSWNLSLEQYEHLDNWELWCVASMSNIFKLGDNVEVADFKRIIQGSKKRETNIRIPYTCNQTDHTALLLVGPCGPYRKERGMGSRENWQRTNTSDYSPNGKTVNGGKQEIQNSRRTRQTNEMETRAKKQQMLTLMSDSCIDKTQIGRHWPAT